MRNYLLIIAIAAGCSQSAPEPAAHHPSALAARAALPVPVLPATPSPVLGQRERLHPRFDADKLRARFAHAKLTDEQRTTLDEALAPNHGELVRGTTAMRKRAFELTKQTR